MPSKGFARQHKAKPGQAERARAADHCVPCVHKQGTINTLHANLVGERSRADAFLLRLKEEGDAAAAAKAAAAATAAAATKARNATRRKAAAARRSCSAIERMRLADKRWKMSQEATRKKKARRAGKAKTKTAGTRGGGASRKATPARQHCEACTSEHGGGRRRVSEDYLRG